jgi:hypothetical protein
MLRGGESRRGLVGKQVEVDGFAVHMRWCAQTCRGKSGVRNHAEACVVCEAIEALLKQESASAYARILQSSMQVSITHHAVDQLVDAKPVGAVHCLQHSSAF